jgi:FAD dependent oxidoreductase
MRISADQPPEAGVVTLSPPAAGQGVSCDVLVVGAGTGGVAAALAAAEGGHSVCLTEESNWVGGQMTAQGVAALDENKYIESGGATASYLKLRDAIRAYYQQHYKLSAAAEREKHFNPGSCWVGALCFEPAAALDAIQSMLKPYQSSGLLRIFLRTKAISVARSGNRVTSILAYNFDSDVWTSFRARYVLDATETGDVLPLAGAEYVTGAEARTQTGEPHARPEEADPTDSQSFTYPFVLTRNSSGEHQLPKPPDYEKRRDAQPYSLSVDYGNGKTLTYRMFERSPGTPGSFWTYRRLIASANFVGKNVPREASMINWPGNDYCGPALLLGDADQQAQALREAKLTSLGFAYWLQNEAPWAPEPALRPKSGGAASGAGAPRDVQTGEDRGYPELELVTSVLGSKDGLSQFPYIRESRRVKALKTVREQDISALYQKGARAGLFPDSVGIGWYPIDIHSCSKRDFSTGTRPFQIPLGALVPQGLANLLPAAKNIGTTHITNGPYRVHPVEWAIGEAAGVLADFAIDHDVTPAVVAGDDRLTEQVQIALLDRGVPIFWYDDVAPVAPVFRDAQLLAQRGIFGPNKTDLHFNAGGSVTLAEAVTALARQLGLGAAIPTKRALSDDKVALDAFTLLAAQGYMPAGLTPGELGRKLQWSDFQMACAKTGVEAPIDEGEFKPATRGAFAVWLAQLYRKTLGAPNPPSSP